MNILISSNFKKHFNTHIDFVDHYWIRYFDLKKIDFLIIPNSKRVNLNLLLRKKLDLIILPGGNDLLEKNNLSKIRLKNELNLIHFGIKHNIPILGICRGMQVINYYFKGKQKKILKHMNTEHKVFFRYNFFKKKILKVNSYHNYSIPKKLLSKNLNAMAFDKDENVEFLNHKSKKIFGFMWHPERNKNYHQLDEILKKII